MVTTDEMKSGDPPEPKPPDASKAVSPGSSKDALLTTPAQNLELPSAPCSSVATLEPFDESVIRNVEAPATTSSCMKVRHSGQKILYLKSITLDSSYGHLAEEFRKYGCVTEIRMKLVTEKQVWEAWIAFAKHEEALRACKETRFVNCSLVDKPPGKLEIYKPTEWNEESLNNIPKVERAAKPPEWLIATARGERCNLIRMSKHLQRKVGYIKRTDISRFGRNSVLIHAKSATQSVMLSNMKIDTDSILYEIKPHYNFSYGKGVIFDDNVYDFTEQEILQMSPNCVWKVYKVPKSKMVILTFEDSNIPSEIYFENIVTEVRPFKPRPLQCYNCFGFGHPSKVCKKEKLCSNCSQTFHGQCERSSTCVNCKGHHNPRDKNCSVHKKEQEALLKSQAEHISVGYAKKLLAKSKKYSEVVSSSGTPRKTTTQNRTANGEANPTGPEPVASHSGYVKEMTPKPQRAPRAPRVPRSASDLGTSCNSKSQVLLRRDRLSPSDFEICEASQAPSSPIGASQASSRGASQASPKGASRASSKGASRASSAGASLVVSLPDLGITPPRRQTPDVPPTVVVHRSHDGEEMETRAIGLKRVRAPSPSPPTSPNQSTKVPTKNRYQALASTENPVVMTSPSSLGESNKGEVPRKKGTIKDRKMPQDKISLSNQSKNLKCTTERPAKKAPKNK